MATQGPLYPTTITSDAAVAPEDDDAWVNPTNVGSDNGAEAQITAASFDSPDISRRLSTSGYGFTIPAGATINGITVEIERRSIVANSGVDNRVQLRDAAGVLVGTNKATATVWPTTATIATYGGAADTWTASPTVAMVNDPDFGVVLSAKANIANADIGVDFIRVTVTYTPPPAVTSTATWSQVAAAWDASAAMVTGPSSTGEWEQSPVVWSAAMAEAITGTASVSQDVAAWQASVAEGISFSGSVAQAAAAWDAIATHAMPSVTATATWEQTAVWDSTMDGGPADQPATYYGRPFWRRRR